MGTFQNHLGPTLTKSGNLSPRTRRGARFNTSLVYQKLAQIDLANASGAGIPDMDIARILHRSTRYLKNIRSKPSYLAHRYELSTGLPLTEVHNLAENIGRRKEMLMEMMPSALRVIASHLHTAPKSPQEKRLQLTAALEVLDREGSLAKVSKSEVHATHEHSFESIEGVSKELLEAMGGAPARGAEEISELIASNNNFINSEKLTAEEQTKVLENLDTTGPVN